MEKLILLILLFLPFNLWAQSIYTQSISRSGKQNEGRAAELIEINEQRRSRNFAQPELERRRIYSYKLDNGLTLIVKPDHRFPVVTSQIWYKVGSSYEHGGITGISHALEHMMFRGTTQYGPGKLTELVTQHGGIQNAFTDYDFTAYYQVFPEKDLVLSFELEADRMQNLVLNPKLFEKEMKAVQEERRLRIDDVPEARAEERFLAAAYVSSPYHHLVIGWKSDLDHMKVADLSSWYQQWYVPNNAILVVVGDVDPEKTYEFAKQYFGNIPSRALPPIKPQPEIPSLGEKKVTVNIPSNLPYLMVSYLVPTLVTARDAKTAYSLLILSKILSGPESARLEKNLVRQQQVATMVTAVYSFLRRKEGLLSLYGVPAQGHTVAELGQQFLKEIKNLQENLIDPRELERIKALTVAEEVYKKDSISEQAMEIGMLESVGLSYKNIEEYAKQVESVTPEDILHVARTYLIPEKMTVGILNPLPLPPTTLPKKNLS